MQFQYYFVFHTPFSRDIVMRTPVLAYPIVIAVMTLVIGTLFLPETKDVDISK